MKIPFNYLPQQFKNINPIISQWKKLAKSTEFTLGPFVEKFEKQFSKKQGMKYSVMVNSGSSANLIGIYSLFFIKTSFYLLLFFRHYHPLVMF